MKLKKIAFNKNPYKKPYKTFGTPEGTSIQPQKTEEVFFQLPDKKQLFVELYKGNGQWKVNAIRHNFLSQGGKYCSYCGAKSTL